MKLDVVRTTHQHSDHIDNADTILNALLVGTYVDNGTNLEDDDGQPGAVTVLGSDPSRRPNLIR
jgi:beta-lactamase superfamily II metal-dependent hydrolase